VTPALQLVLPRHRLDLPADETRRLAECTREFGKEGPRIAQAVKELLSAHGATDGFLRSPEALPPSGLLGRWRLRRAVKATPDLAAPSGLSDTEPVEDLLRRAAALVVYQDEPGPLAVRRSLGQLLGGPQRFPGGIGGLRELLGHRFLELGGALLQQDGRPESAVRALTVEGGRPVGLDVRDSEATHRAAFLISTLDGSELMRLLPDALRTSGEDALRTPEATHAVLSVHWVLPEEALPRGMGELVLADDVGGIGLCLLQIAPARRAEARTDEPSLRLVTASAVVPPGTEVEQARGHAARIEQAMDRHLPFALARALARSIPQLDAPSPRPGLLLHPLFARPARSPWDPLGVEPTTPWPTLLRAGREVCPGLGVEGELLAALGAVARVQRASQRKRPSGR
jgi:hypothetical protein